VHLVFFKPPWNLNRIQRVYAQKKIYLWDTGLKTLLTGPADEGAKAENAVFMELKRNQIDCGYFAESQKEVDFITGNVEKPMPIEVKYLSSFDWKDRRFSGFKLFLRRFPQTRKGLLITRGIDTVIKSNDTEIIAVPLWRFLLSSNNYLDKQNFTF
jgi:predicted AAA+ superfamily ATPase